MSHQAALPSNAEHLMAVRRAIAAMKEGLEDPRRLCDLAQAASYSPWHFHRMFHVATNTTPARYLAAVRMQSAKVLLAETCLTVGTISASVGYQSVGTFTSQFARLVGIPPGGYRRLIDSVAGLQLDPDRIGTSSRGPRVQLSSTEGEITPEGIVLIGLFRADLPQGTPESFAALRSFSGRLASQPRHAAYDAFGVTLPAEAGMLELALGSLESTHVGHQRIAYDRPMQELPISIEMRKPRDIDPPIVSAAAALQFAQAARC